MDFKYRPRLKGTIVVYSCRKSSSIGVLSEPQCPPTDFSSESQGFHSQNFCAIFAERNAKFGFSLRISFARINSNLRNHSQKSFRAQSPVPQLEFCAIPQTLIQIQINSFRLFLVVPVELSFFYGNKRNTPSPSSSILVFQKLLSQFSFMKCIFPRLKLRQNVKALVSGKAKTTSAFVDNNIFSNESSS